MDRIVSDSGPLISLSRVGQTQLLNKLFDVIEIPKAVSVEVFGEQWGRPGSELREARWLKVSPDPTASEALRHLGPGERAAIGLALSLKVRLLLDDQKAREAAERRGVLCFGTLKVLARAKKAGLISEVRPILQSLITQDFRLSRNWLTISCKTAANRRALGPGMGLFHLGNDVQGKHLGVDSCAP
jgi:predicted nucleic acid-binding protein